MSTTSSPTDLAQQLAEWGAGLPFNRPVFADLVVVAEVSEADAAVTLDAHAAGDRPRIDVTVRLESADEHVGDVGLEFVFVPATPRPVTS